MRKILGSLVIIGTVSVSLFGLSKAFFSDLEISLGNVLGAESLDLKINDADNPVAIVDVDDLMPGIDKIVEKRLKIIDNDGNVWMHIKDLVSSGGIETEPETQEESISGEKHDIENFIKYDLSVADDVLIDFEDDVLFPEAVSCWIPLGGLTGDEETTVHQSFHLDPDVTNWAQGDSLTFTEEFYAEQDGAGPALLEGNRIWNAEEKKCVEEEIISKHNLVFTCVSGCSGTFPHTLNIDSFDASGNFDGAGFYNTNPAYTWDVTGNAGGTNFDAHVLYTGSGAGYFVDLTGTRDASGNANGTATSSTSQTFTWVLN